MANTPNSEARGNRLFVLALGLLVGFTIGFVMLLSRLPVDGAVGFSIDDPAEIASDSAYQFYSMLEEQTTAQRVRNVQPPIAVQKSIPPATRVVPGNALRMTPRSLATEGYAEIPANSLGQESYYLQAGNYRHATEAEQARATVLLLGLEAFIVVRRDADGVNGHRVRIGPYFDQKKVSAAKMRLKKAGINYKLIRVTG